MGKKSTKKKKDTSPKKSSNRSAASKEKETVKKALKKAKEPTQGHRKSSRLASSDNSIALASSSTTSHEKGKSAGKSKTASAAAQATKEYRRKPVEIDGSDDNLDNEEVTTSKKSAVSPHKEMSDSEDEDNEDQDDDAAVESAKEDDLVDLSAAKAKETLQLEQPQWSAKKDNARSQKDTKRENNSHKQIPLAKRKRGDDTGSDTSDSESDSDSESSSSSSESDTSNSSDSSDSDDDSDDSTQEQDDGGGGASSSKKSKRAQDRQSEGAKWKDNRKVSVPVKRQKIKARNVNEGWSKKAHYAAPTGRAITLKDQPKRLRIILKKAIDQAEGDILFVNAFPSGTDTDSYVCKLLKRRAQEHKNQALVSRIKNDSSFRSALAPLITSRMNRLRGSIKKLVSSGVIKATYSLPSNTAECQAKVAELQKSMDYIYPLGPNSMVDRTKPYRNELVISILRDYIFSGRHSLASKFSNRFESSIDTDEDNVEIPISMLALVGTAISAGLEDWSTGKYKKNAWSTETHSGAYENHVEFITSSIFKADKKKFHSLTSRLYQLASNMPGQASGSAKISNVQSNFNIDDMNDDD